MSPKLAATCIRQAALGAAAHEVGVVHRDIEPHNILVSRSGVCQLTDFGIARVSEVGRTKVGAVMGTQGHMAPEQAKDASSVDVRGDVFSLGMTLFVLLTGCDPVERLAGRGLELVPEPLRELIEQATAFDRNRRPADMAAFIAGLDAALPHLTDPPGSPVLRLPETFGEPLDAEEVSTLRSGLSSAGDGATNPGGEASAPTPVTPPPAATPRTLPYRVPVVATRSDRTPDYVERSATPPPERRTEISVEAPSRTVPPSEPRSPPTDAEEQEAEGLSAGAVAEEGGKVLRQVVDLVLRAVMDPTRMAGPMALLLVVFLGIPYASTRELRRVSAEAREAGQVLDTLVAEGEAMDAVTALGGDTATLEVLLHSWQSTPEEPERSQAAQRYVDALDNEVRRYAVPGMEASDRARVAVQRLREAVVARKRTWTDYAEQRDSVSGCLAIGVTPP
jgi:hypothetical protein